MTYEDCLKESLSAAEKCRTTNKSQLAVNIFEICGEYQDLFFSQRVSGQDEPNPAIWLVPGAGGIFRSWPRSTERAEQELATCIEIWENKGVSFSYIASCDFWVLTE